MLYNCTKIKPVWHDLEQIISDLVTANVTLDIQEVLFGVNKENLKVKNYIVNLVIYEAKWQIWKNRNAVKYGQKHCLSRENLMINIKLGCQTKSKLHGSSPENYKLKQKLESCFERLLQM